MKELLRYWEDTFYTNIATFFIAVIALFISIKRGRQNAKLKPLQIFLLGYVIDIFLTFLITASNSLNDDLIVYTDFIDTVIEFLAFFFFIKTHIVSKKIKKVLNPVLPFFIGGVLLYSIYYFIYYKLNHSLMDQHFLQNIFTIQAVLLLIACAFYYIDLFTKEPKSA